MERWHWTGHFSEGALGLRGEGERRLESGIVKAHSL